MKKLIFTLTICVFFAATSVFGQNYGDISTSGGSGNVSLGVWPGWLNTSPYYRLGIYTSTINGMEINASGNNAFALSVSASGTNSRALSVNGQSYLNNTYVSTSIGIGIVNSSMATHEKLAIRNGMITTSGISNGISLNGSYHSSTPNDFGTQRYGLFMGDGALVNLSSAQSSGYKPIVLSSFYGLAFDVYGGKMAFCQNGAVYIGGNDAGAIAEIESVADKSISNIEYQLYVEKGVCTEKVKVTDVNNFPDFVFEEDYNLPSLTTVENYITQNKHLPNVPSAATVEKDGLDLAEMDKILLQKIEELTLYTIEQQKQIEALKEELETLRK